MRLLIVEDNHTTAKLLSSRLSSHYTVDLAETGQRGEYLATINDYQLLIIDVGLPDISGLDLIKILRKQEIAQPILILSGYGQPQQIAQGLEAGADDYLAKPFEMIELRARLNSLTRRKPKFTGNFSQAGPFKFDHIRKKLWFHQQPIKLSRKETLILNSLFRNQGRIMTKQLITTCAWEKSYLNSNTLEVHINRLRSKIDRRFDYQLIETVHGRGYTIKAD